MFESFDPLLAKQSAQTEVAVNALKREIQNTLDSYQGWFDPFCELIQNALDSLDDRTNEGIEGYNPTIRIIVNIQTNSLTVTDNGTGLSKEKFEQFLAPAFSFKSGKTRGHKGVGATFLAYGFNDIQIATKCADFTAVGRMKNARKWLTDTNPSGNPKVAPDKDSVIDSEFDSFSSGVSITVFFGENTRPSKLSWLQATTAEQWYKILAIKTGLGAIIENPNIHFYVKVVGPSGGVTEKSGAKISYLWPHLVVPRTKSMSSIVAEQDRLFKKHGPEFKMPPAYNNLDAIYDFYDKDSLPKVIDIEESENLILNQFQPIIYFCYTYSAKVWVAFNEELKIRSGQLILHPGIQIAANNMPQGEIVQIPLKRYSGRQNQIHMVLHLQNCRSDLGRKGFQKEIVEFGQEVGRKLIEKPLLKLRSRLRPTTGTKSDIIRENEVDEWKTAFVQHEKEKPLVIVNEHFFLPTNHISLTSAPTREQDVIALFNQLLAGGVIRGIRIMSTNERFTYDGMYRIVIEEPHKHHLYDEKTNPLGILPEYLSNEEDFRSAPKILEYKFSLDGLIEDIDAGIKNSNDISLVVVWETGLDYEGNYYITSLLDPDNLSERQYHGVTHIMTNVNSNQREMDLIVLSELIAHLNDSNTSIETQRQKYAS